MTLLENEAFLAELGKLFERSKAGGPKTLGVTMKRYNGRTKPVPRTGKAAKSGGANNATHPPNPPSSSTGGSSKEGAGAAGKAQREQTSQEKLCLVRAKLGNAKISTVIHAKEATKFLLAYTQVLKTHTGDALKKREK